MSNGKKLELKEKKMNTKLLREETEVKQIKTDKTCPIGYKRNPSTYSIEIDELKAPKIRELFNTLAYEEPLSDEYTINMLIGLCRDNLAKICSIIQNPFYCGFIEINGDLYRGMHTPLIDNITWEMANESLAEMLDRMVEIIKENTNDEY